MKSKVPKLRFKNKNGEEYPDWEENKLKILFNITVGGELSKKNYSLFKNEKFKYPVYSNSIDNNGLYGYSDIYKTKENTITVTGRGNIGVAKVRYCKYYPIVRLLNLNPIKDLNLKFFEENINNIKIINESSGIPQLTSPQLSNVKIKYPSLEEQTKIANFFINIDEIIETQNKKVENLESFKKSLMQKIFNQEVRFKDENGEYYPKWEKKKLGHILIEFNSKTIVNNQYPILTSSAEGIKLQKDYFKKYVSREKNIGYKIIPYGYATYRSMSDTGIFHFNLQNLVEFGIISPAYPVFCCNENNFLSYILLFLNHSNIIKCKILSLKQGGTRFTLKLSKLKELKVYIPCLKEQMKIIEVLCNLDKIIEKEYRKLKGFKDLKKGLMYKMFI